MPTNDPPSGNDVPTETLIEMRNRRAAQVNAVLKLPRLVGSEKQIAWAETIRLQIFHYLGDSQALRDLTDAKAWIDLRFYRSCSRDELNDALREKVGLRPLNNRPIRAHMRYGTP